MHVNDALAHARSLILDVPDYPQPGVLFRDVSPLLADPTGFATITQELATKALGATHVAGIEARGFVLGAAVASKIGAGFIALRKPGKLPREVLRAEYLLEYGSDALEVHADAMEPGTRVLVIDDVLATGGTLLAAIELMKQAGADVVGAAVLVDLPALGGRARIEAAVPDMPLYSIFAL
jgi:adenine phosphoribosyltransferase